MMLLCRTCERVVEAVVSVEIGFRCGGGRRGGRGRGGGGGGGSGACAMTCSTCSIISSKSKPHQH
jgi:hypothetical protein